MLEAQSPPIGVLLKLIYQKTLPKCLKWQQKFRKTGKRVKYFEGIKK
jgi:hypothetical protein